jgi:hypothetical protein
VRACCALLNAGPSMPGIVRSNRMRQGLYPSRRCAMAWLPSFALLVVEAWKSRRWETASRNVALVVDYEHLVPVSVRLVLFRHHHDSGHVGASELKLLALHVPAPRAGRCRTVPRRCRFGGVPGAGGRARGAVPSRAHGQSHPRPPGFGFKTTTAVESACGLRRFWVWSTAVLLLESAPGTRVEGLEALTRILRAAGLETGSTRILRVCTSPAMRSCTRGAPDTARKVLFTHTAGAGAVAGHRADSSVT